MILYEVAVDAPIATSLTYGQPAESVEEIAPGFCVQVPLGRRQVNGYVLGRINPPSTEKKAFTIKEITGILSTGPVFPPSLIEFYLWIANYYHYPPGEVIKTALPLTAIPKGGKELLLTAAGREQVMNVYHREGPKSSPPWLEVLTEKGKLSTAALTKVWRNPDDQRLIKKLVADQLLEIRIVAPKARIKEKTQRVLQPVGILSEVLDQGEIKSEQILDTLTKNNKESLTKAEAKALGFFLDIYLTNNQQPVPQRQISRLYKNCSNPLKSLGHKELIMEEKQRVYRDPFGEVPVYHAPPEHLTAEQTQVLEQVIPEIEQQQFHPFLLFGVTGCGKTEVYLQAAQQALNSGKTALVLVPEIALATQLEAHFHSRFGSQLAVLHSGLTPGERFDQWHRVMHKEARVVIGARSAVFAPLENLGIIIVDEEHEPAYKQEAGLRYNGRDLAVLRARFASCPVVLGSATPSITSYHHCRQEKYTLLTMYKRVADQQLPVVELIDLTKEKKSRPDLFLSDRLMTAIGNNLDNRQQTLLFVNRRGFSSSMLCRDCGHILQCRHCQVSLTLHRGKGQMICHYCGFSQQPDVLCPSCRSSKIVGLGLGSERIEQEVSELFPHARVARLDSDIAVKRKNYLSILKAVRERDVDILIGTQMIAKGLHFPHITLVGVVWADAGLAMPDYKASERTFSLLSQVTGRAGRGEIKGRVIIQTHQPDHYAIRLSQGHDYVGLYEQEIAARSALGYPPFSRLVNIKISGKDEKQVQTSSQNVAAFLHQHNTEGKVELLGPSPAPLVRLRDRTRWQLMMKSSDTAAAHRLCGALLAVKAKLCHRTVRLSVDVDPENMM